MTYSQAAVHRTILVIDVEGFGDRRRTTPHQLAVRDGMYRALRQAFDKAGIPWTDCDHEDRGDGVFVLAPAEMLKAPFVDSVPLALVTAVREHNTSHSKPEERIRLRMALHAGEVAYDEHGVTAASVNLTFRLLDARAVKTALAESPGVLALITSEWFFDEVVRHSSKIDPATFRPVRVAVKETATVGWISLPDYPYSPDPDRRPTVEQASGLFLEGAGGPAWLRARVLIVVGIVLVVVMTAVTIVVANSIGSTPPAPVGVGNAFVGDPRTADPCALVDLTALEEFGEPRTNPDNGAFNECQTHVSLRRFGSLEVDLHVRLEEGPDVDSFETPQPPAGAWSEPVVVREEMNGDQCRRIVFLPEQYRVVIAAWQNRHPEVLCDTAEALVQGVIDAYHRGPLPRRMAAFPPESVTSLNACDLLSTAELADSFGTSQITSENGLANWSCYWDSPESDPMVQIDYYKGDPMSDGKVLDLAGHQVLLDPESGGQNKCLAAIAFRPYLEGDMQKIEVVEIVWRSEKPSEQRCAAVTTLATIVAEKLR